MVNGSRNNHHAEWLRAQSETWRNRAGGYAKTDWVRRQDFINSMVDFCEPRPEWDAIDIGTGPGIIAVALRPKVARVVGIDLAPEMIAQAMERHGGIPDVSFAVGNVEKLQFPDDSFDLATARMVFHHVDDCPLGFSEIWRVLRPGGWFVFCEGVPPDHRTRPRYEEIFALKEKRHCFSEAELINLFDRAGFEDILVKPYFMRQVSLNNWLANEVLEPSVVGEIRRLHTEADQHFKEAYRLVEYDGDVFMDWKFILIRGRKPPAAWRRGEL